MSTMTASDAAKAVVRRNTEEVQGGGNFGVFEELFADDFVDHTPQPNTTPDKAGVRKLYGYIRAAFPESLRNCDVIPYAQQQFGGSVIIAHATKGFLDLQEALRSRRGG